MMRKVFNALVMLCACAWLVGCGTPYATVKSGTGDPVMLLGHDPVAYFTDARPMRGKPDLKVSLPERTYYFATPEHRALFIADPAKYEPQYGGFCSSGAAFGIKLGSDPTAWEIFQGRLYISATSSARPPGRSIRSGT